MIFIIVISPILEEITAIIVSALEVIRGKCSVKVAEYNHQISNIGKESTDKIRQIGFEIPSTEEDDYEED